MVFGNANRAGVLDEEVDRILDALNMKWTPNPDVTRQHCLAVVTGTPLNVPYYPYPT